MFSDASVESFILSCDVIWILASIWPHSRPDPVGWLPRILLTRPAPTCDFLYHLLRPSNNTPPSPHPLYLQTFKSILSTTQSVCFFALLMHSASQQLLFPKGDLFLVYLAFETRAPPLCDWSQAPHDHLGRSSLSCDSVTQRFSGGKLGGRLWRLLGDH